MNFLKLFKIPNKEPLDTWDSICQNPDDLLNAIIERLGIEKEENFDNVVISEKVPGPSERKKLWIKTTWPYGIGIVIDGAYRMNWSLSGFVPNTYFLANKMDPIPQFVREISHSEETTLGLPKTDKDINKIRYYIFEPPEVNY